MDENYLKWNLIKDFSGVIELQNKVNYGSSCIWRAFIHLGNIYLKVSLKTRKTQNDLQS